MSAELMTQGERDQRRRRLSELNSALDLMANDRDGQNLVDKPHNN